MKISQEKIARKRAGRDDFPRWVYIFNLSVVDLPLLNYSEELLSKDLPLVLDPQLKDNHGFVPFRAGSIFTRALYTSNHQPPSWYIWWE